MMAAQPWQFCGDGLRAAAELTAKVQAGMQKTVAAAGESIALDSALSRARVRSGGSSAQGGSLAGTGMPARRARRGVGGSGAPAADPSMLQTDARSAGADADAELVAIRPIEPWRRSMIPAAPEADVVPAKAASRVSIQFRLPGLGTSRRDAALFSQLVVGLIYS